MEFIFSQEGHTGNCREHGLNTVEYIHNHHPEINAEAYCIKNGDHMFVVVGREPLSDISDPTTWGTDCYIADSWSKKVYKASEWESKLKDFRWTYDQKLYGKKGLRTLEPLNSAPDRMDQLLVPYGYNTNLLKKVDFFNRVLTLSRVPSPGCAPVNMKAFLNGRGRRKMNEFIGTVGEAGSRVDHLMSQMSNVELAAQEEYQVRALAAQCYALDVSFEHFFDSSKLYLQSKGNSGDPSTSIDAKTGRIKGASSVKEILETLPLPSTLKLGE